MIQGQDPQNPDFPHLTRSQRIAPEILSILQGIDTANARSTRAISRKLRQLDEVTLRTLPEIIEQALGTDHSELAKALHRLAVFDHSHDNTEKAEILYRRALRTAERSPSISGMELGLILSNLGRLLYEKKDYSEAEKLYQRAVEILRNALGPEDPKLATPLGNLASLYMDQGQWELAENLFEDSIAILEKALGPNHPKVLKARKKLNAAKLRNHRPSK